MAIALRSAATIVVESGNNGICNKPAGTIDGDFLFAQVLVRSGSGAVPATPAGWTLLRSDSVGSSGGARQALFYKFASGESASYTFSWVVTAAGLVRIAAYTGVNTTSPVAASSVGSNSITAATLTAPSVTPLTATSLLLWLGGVRDLNSGGTLTKPSSMTLDQTFSTILDGTDLTATTSSEALSSITATGTRTGVPSPNAIGIVHNVILTPVGANIPPIANAGIDQDVNTNTLVTLAGSGSDSDGTVTNYAWSQVSGTTASLAGATTATATFTPTLSGTYVFRLTVTDDNSATGTDDVTITVFPAGVRSIVSTNGTSATVTGTVPASAQVGDLAIFAVATTGIGTLTTSPTGWDFAGSGVAGTSGSGTRLHVFTRILQGGDAGAVISLVVGTSGAWVTQAVCMFGLHARAVSATKITTPLLTVPSISATVQGTPGTTTYSYKVAPVSPEGEILTPATRTVVNGPAVFSSTNRIDLSWAPIPRARTYQVYRDSGSGYKLIGTATRYNVTDPMGVVTGNYKHGFFDTVNTPGTDSPQTNSPMTAIIDMDAPEDSLAIPIPYANAILLGFFVTQATTADPTLVWSDPGGMTNLRSNIGPANKLVLSSKLRIGLATTDSPAEVAAITQPITNWVTAGLILRPTAANSTPVADAGTDQDVYTGETVHLAGVETIDADGDTPDLTYTWTQTAGPTVTMTGATTATPSFTAPPQPASLTFRLTVTDPSSQTSTDDVTITTVRMSSAFVYNGTNLVGIDPAFG